MQRRERCCHDRVNCPIAARAGDPDRPFFDGRAITEAANSIPNVVPLVDVAGFAPEAGETSLILSAKFRGSTMGDSRVPVVLPDADEGLYSRVEKFRAMFAADVPRQTSIIAATQRPVKLSALAEPSATPARKMPPSYIIYGTSDRNIPAVAMKLVAERAHARKMFAIDGGRMEERVD